MAIKLKSRASNGNMYYLIGSEEITKAHIVVVNTIEERNSLSVDGFVFVRNPSEGSPNDSTVHRGWAMYFSYLDGSEVNWVKVAEEESVDGIWGIEEEVLRQFATRKELSSIVANQDAKNKIYDELRTIIASLDKHSHTNKEVLEIFGEKYRQPTLKIAVSATEKKEVFLKDDTFIYKEAWVGSGSSARIPWYDPTVLRSTITSPTTYATTKEIATLFAATRAATVGMIFRVMEYDGSYSEYLITSKMGSTQANPMDYYEDPTTDPIDFKRAEFVRMIGANRVNDYNGMRCPTIGLVCVEYLPPADPTYTDGRIFCVVGNGLCGTNISNSPARGKIGHFYKCIKQTSGEQYSWFDIVPEDVYSTGCVITSCHLSDPTTVRLTYTDPLQTVADVSGVYLKSTSTINNPEMDKFIEEMQTPTGVVKSIRTRKTLWSKSVIVRKIGSAPKNITDGQIVYESTTYNEFKDTPFIDTVPESEQNIFYGVFAFTVNGSMMHPFVPAYSYPSALSFNPTKDYDIGDYCTNLSGTTWKVYRCKQALPKMTVYFFSTTYFEEVPPEKNKAQAKFPNWSYITNLIENGNFGKAFALGDYIATNPWKTSGPLSCRVCNIDDTNRRVRLVSYKSIGDYIYDKREPGMRPTNDTSWVASKDYYFATVSGNTAVYTKVEDASAYSGSPRENHLYEAFSATSLYNPTYNQTTHVMGGNGNWNKSNICKWLNSQAYSNWFTSSDTGVDLNGIEEARGFIAYLSHYTTEQQKFGLLIKSVELPSSSNGGISYANGDTIWTMDQLEDSPNAKEHNYCDSPEDDVDEAGVAHEIHPVFVLGSDAAASNVQALTQFQGL